MSKGHTRTRPTGLKPETPYVDRVNAALWGWTGGGLSSDNANIRGFGFIRGGSLIVSILECISRASIGKMPNFTKVGVQGKFSFLPIEDPESEILEVSVPLYIAILTCKVLVEPQAISNF